MNKYMNGLSQQEYESNIKSYGVNVLSKAKTATLLEMFLETFEDVFIRIICVALVFKVIVYIVGIYTPIIENSFADVVEVISILLAILLSTGFSTISTYKNTTRSTALQEEYSKSLCKVIRDGEIKQVYTNELTVHDLVLVQAGDKVPADGIVIKGTVKVSQAALNGESEDVTRTPAINLAEAEATDFNRVKHKLYMGSTITAGEAHLLITVIGDATELGKINSSLVASDEDEVQDTSSAKLDVVAKWIGKLGLIAASITSTLQIGITFLYMTTISPTIILNTLIEAVLLFASIIIMAVPEGLPMMNSLVQSLNTETLYKKHILVSHKAAFADTAYMDLLFTDKTGTVTQGVLTAIEFITGTGEIERNIDYDPDFVKLITWNNLAHFDTEGKAVGSNNMDRALLSYARAFHRAHIVNPEYVSINGFDSEKKYASCTLEDGTVYLKGAPEIILKQCNQFLQSDGKVIPLTAGDIDSIQYTIDEQAARCMKMLAIAEKKPDGNTILHVIICLRDDVREDAADTVATLHRAGIQVVMVTGDAHSTACAIAKEAGIYNPDSDDVCLTHEQLATMSDADLSSMLPNLRVVSRAHPMDKKRLVSLAQQDNHVVGMTGDGVNDAPALKAADIGFAMGDGTAVAQEAGDVVILNNSLTSIKDCVLNSRTMAKSVGKFLIFQLTVNVTTLLMNIIAPLTGWTEPFTIVQILWINLIMDTLAALAFGKEPILDRYMLEKPVKKAAPILTSYIKSAILTVSLFITAVSIGLLLTVYNGNVVYTKTIMFAFFIYAIIINAFNTRSEKFNLFEGIFQNPNFIFVMFGIFIMQTLLIEFAGSIFGTTTLNWLELCYAFVLALFIVPLDFIRKAVTHKP